MTRDHGYVHITSFNEGFMSLLVILNTSIMGKYVRIFNEYFEEVKSNKKMREFNRAQRKCYTVKVYLKGGGGWKSEDTCNVQ